MPALPKLKKTKKVKEPKELTKPEKGLHDSITEVDVSDDFFFTTRRVRFSASVQQCPVMSLEDYTESEIRLTWFSKEDKAKMNKAHDKVVRRHEAGKRCKRGMTYRGLDAWTDKGHEKFEALINKLLNTVMDEQDNQWSQGYNDPDRLALASQTVSKKNLLQALRYAEQDEFEAQEVFTSGTFRDEVTSDEIEDSTRTMSTAMATKRQSRRRRSSEKKGTGDNKDEKEKRKSKRKSGSKTKKSEQ